MSEVTLSQRERQQLLTVLRELEGNTDPEQRRHTRRKTRIQLTIKQLRKNGAPRATLAILVNVSARGVGILASRLFAKGDKFLMPLKFDEGGGWLVLCEVRNCTEYGPAAYKVGARFLDKIEDPSGTSKPPMDWLL